MVGNAPVVGGAGRSVASRWMGVVMMVICMLAAAPAQGANKGSSTSIELEPRVVPWAEPVVVSCARAQLGHLISSTMAARAAVAQSCTALVLETSIFVVRVREPVDRRVARKTRARRSRRHTELGVHGGSVQTTAWTVERPPDEITGDEARYLVGRQALKALRHQLAGRVAESAACRKVVVRYHLDPSCTASVDVNVIDPASLDDEVAIEQAMRRAVADVRRRLDCASFGEAMTGTVSLLPMREPEPATIQLFSSLD